MPGFILNFCHHGILMRWCMTPNQLHNHTGCKQAQTHHFEVKPHVSTPVLLLIILLCPTAFAQIGRSQSRKSVSKLWWMSPDIPFGWLFCFLPIFRNTCNNSVGLFKTCMIIWLLVYGPIFSDVTIFRDYNTTMLSSPETDDPSYINKTEVVINYFFL